MEPASPDVVHLLMPSAADLWPERENSAATQVLAVGLINGVVMLLDLTEYLLAISGLGLAEENRGLGTLASKPAEASAPFQHHFRKSFTPSADGSQYSSEVTLPLDNRSTVISPFCSGMKNVKRPPEIRWPS